MARTPIMPEMANELALPEDVSVLEVSVPELPLADPELGVFEVLVLARRSSAHKHEEREVAAQ